MKRTYVCNGFSQRGDRLMPVDASRTRDSALCDFGRRGDARIYSMAWKLKRAGKTAETRKRELQGPETPSPMPGSVH
jgi:hypothetical protein